MQLDPDHGQITGVTADPAHLPPTDLHSPVTAQNRGSMKPSGFWTGYRPAVGGAYKWNLMAVGGVVLAITAVLLIRLLRRASRSRPTGAWPRTTA